MARASPTASALPAAARLDAFIDTFGSGYVDLAIELGVAPERIDTIIDWDAAQRHGVRTDGNMAGASADTLAELARLIAEGELEIPIARRLPAGRGPRRLPRARAPAHAGQDRPRALSAGSVVVARPQPREERVLELVAVRQHALELGEGRARRVRARREAHVVADEAHRERAPAVGASPRPRAA